MAGRGRGGASWSSHWRTWGTEGSAACHCKPSAPPHSLAYPYRPLELLRKESLSGLPPAAARRVLFHAYCAVVPAAPLPGPPLPLAPGLPGPAYYGPVGGAAGPWLQLALYAKARWAGGFVNGGRLERGMAVACWRLTQN